VRLREKILIHEWHGGMGPMASNPSPPCDIFSTGLLNLPSGRHYRYQYLSRTCPDLPSYTLTSVPTGPTLSIMLIF